MSKSDIAQVLAAEAEHAEQHRGDALGPGRRRARPPREPTQVYSLRVPVERLEQLRRLAAEQHLTPSALMRAWVLARLDAEVGHEATGHPQRTANEPAEPLAQMLREVIREELERAGVQQAS